MRRRGLGIPADSADVFMILGRASVISPDVAERMRRLGDFRTVAVREYRRLDPAVVRTVAAHRLGDFVDLCRELSDNERCLVPDRRADRE